MTPFEIIKEIESDNSKLLKAAIVRREAELKNDEFFAGLNLAFNPFITFGIAKIPNKASNQTKSSLTFVAFNNQVQKLIKREVTGHAARDLVQALCDSANTDEWNGWYRRILLKDMRCGMSESTVNTVVYGDFKKKVWVPGIAPQYRIEVFECSLAKPAEDHPNYMKGKKQIDTKMDGNRLLAEIDNITKAVTLFSRNGKELLNFPHIAEQLSKIAGQFTEPMIIDGEIMSKSFQDLMRQVHRKYNVDASDAIYHVFDMVTLKDFKYGLSKVKQKDRSLALKNLCIKNEKIFTSIEFLEYEEIDLDTQPGQDRLTELRRLAATLGAEGVMVKDVDAGYECKRTTNWLKIKPVITIDLKIIDIEIGEEEKKNSDCLGALVCEGIDNGKHIRVNVGSGFDEEQRKEFWKNRKQLIGQTVEITADAITKPKTGDYYSLRFPRFKCFRDDK
jgi:DNA ligase-1